jgi:hypothetical protein
MALSGIYSGMTRGFVTGTEFEAVIRPNDGTHVGRRGVIFCHGYNQDVKNGIDFNSFPGVSRLLRALAQRGVCVLSLDLGGTATFGNDTGSHLPHRSGLRNRQGAVRRRLDGQLGGYSLRR